MKPGFGDKTIFSRSDKLSFWRCLCETGKEMLQLFSLCRHTNPSANLALQKKHFSGSVKLFLRIPSVE
jgi:hypothetical protein